MLSIEIATTFSSETTKKREVSALIEASKELNAKRLFCITLDTEDTIQQNDLTIQILPFWKWAGRKQKRENIVSDRFSDESSVA